MKNTWKKFSFHYTFYIIAISFILTGYFKHLVIFTTIISFHELGHYLFMRLFDWDITKITIYPFGGIIKTNNIINSNLKSDFLIAIAGLIFQMFYYILMIILYKYNIISIKTFIIFKQYNLSIFLFNLLPIIPLDGSKVLNIILNKKISYKLSCYLNVILSLLTILITILLINKFNYSYLMILLVLMLNIYKYYKNIEYYFNKFLLERYLYNLKYKKIKIINKSNKMMKQHTHIIKNKSKYISEEDFLHKLFDLK